MLKYKDFVPKQIEAPRFFNQGTYEGFEHAIFDANTWVADNSITLVSIETVVLPNIWDPREEGSSDGSLSDLSSGMGRWHQFIRCWYKDV